MAGFDTNAAPMMIGLNDYTVDPLYTVGEEVNGYFAPGILDGMGAFALDDNTVRLLVNSELNDNDGYLYTLNPGTANELQITGTRISFFDIDIATWTINDAGLAYDAVFDIQGNLVTDVSQIPNSAGGTDGFGRFCSGQYFTAGTFGLVDDIYFAGEEIDNGLGIALDIAEQDLYLTPYLGRGGWENGTFVETGNDNFVAAIWTDDSAGSFIYLWVGEKDTNPNAGFLDRNGLGATGKLYAWVPDAGNLVDSVANGPDYEIASAPAVEGGDDVINFGEIDPRDRIAADSYGNGSWQELTIIDPNQAGNPGYDEFGFALEPTLRQESADLGAMAWSRPEDIDTNPANGSQFVVANTGRQNFAGGFDSVGDIMVGTVDFSAIANANTIDDIADGSITTVFDLIYDGDADPDRTLRSPDNLDWATDGFIYVQEDRAAGGLWGLPGQQVQGPDPVTGGNLINSSESQIVRIDPNNGNPADGGATPVAVMDRSAVPEGQIDIDPDDAGDWESSGILDVSELFGREPGDLLVFNVQAHSVRGGLIGDPNVDNADPTSDDSNLVEGGQIGFLKAPFDGKTDEPAMMTGLNGYTVDPLVTNGDVINGYAPPGILDGIGAYELDANTVRVLVNSELNDDDGYLYTLNPGTANELEITGTRISFFDIDKTTRNVEDAGLAYDNVFDIEGNLVTSVDQIPNSAGGTDGFGRFCSGQFFEAGSFGLVDDIYFAGEEIDNGLGIALDIANRDLYLTPYLGRGGWENGTFVETGNDNFVAALWTDDSAGSFTYLWVGEKDTSAGASFLDRNGLGADGKLYVWKPDSGNLVDSNPNGPDFEVNSAPAVEGGDDIINTGEIDVRDRIASDSYGNGSWVELTVKDESMAGQAGYDEFGFALEPTLRQEAADKGGLAWSRPEDIDTNPNDGTQFVIANTGRDGFADGFDKVGDLMVGDINFSALNGLTSIDQVADESITTTFTLIYDGDADPNQILRSPDNLDWAEDGFIYAQEDRAASGLWGEGAINQSESQIVRIDPTTGNPGSGNATPVAVMDRSAVPPGQVDIDPDDAGDWESSGILDVSTLFGEAPGSLFIFDVQAHSVRGGAIGDPNVDNSDPRSDDSNLVQGGQLAFLEAPTRPALADPTFEFPSGEDPDTDDDDRLVGTPGDDRLSGGDDDERINAGDGDDVVRGGGGDDRLLGGDGNDRLFGDDGDDVLRGGDGDDRLVGGEGNDVLAGQDGDDRLLGQNGNDILRGGDGDDVLRGGDGRDTLVGQDGGDRLVGGNGNDTLRGGRGDDVLRGNNGNDRLLGQAGDDRLIGGDGNDRLVGGAGRDFLRGNVGNDTLIGGAGPDTFAIARRDGRDRIRDFTIGQDTIRLLGRRFSVDDLEFVERGGGDNTLIKAGDDNIAVLIGVTVAEVEADTSAVFS